MRFEVASLILGAILLASCNGAGSVPDSMGSVGVGASTTGDPSGINLSGRPANDLYAGFVGKVDAGSVENFARNIATASKIKEIKAELVSVSGLPSSVRHAISNSYKEDYVWAATVTGDIVWPFGAPRANIPRSNSICIYLSPINGGLVTAQLRTRGAGSR